MNWKFEDENKPYSSEDAYDDLEAIKAMLHEAQRKINRNKLEDSGIDFSINLDVDNSEKEQQLQYFFAVAFFYTFFTECPYMYVIIRIVGLTSIC